MTDELALIPSLHYDAFARLAVFDYRFSATKEYRCSTPEEVDRILKEGVRQAKEKFPLWAALVAVELKDAPEGRDIIVNLEYKKFRAELHPTIKLKNDKEANHSSGLQGYEERKVIVEEKEQLGTSVQVEQAWSTALQKEVILKTFSNIVKMRDADDALKEAFAQAQVEHPNNCCILDIAFCADTRYERAFKLHLVLEKLSRDVGSDIASRLEPLQPYSEIEMLVFLSQVTSGLLHAKRKVTIMQKFAHCDVKPHNIFISDEGCYKVGDFGSTWEKTIRSLTSTIDGTQAYLSPEARLAKLEDTKVEPFASDVYSLGVTLLHMGKLDLSLSIVGQSAEELKSVIETELNSLPYSQRLLALLAEMLSINPTDRPILESIALTVDAMLGKPQLGDSTEYWNMTREQLAVEEFKMRKELAGLDSSRDGRSGDVYFRAAQIAYHQQEYSKAHSLALQSIVFHETIFGEAHPLTAEVYCWIAELLFRRLNQFSEAEQMCGRCVDIFRQAQDEPGLARAYNRLSCIYHYMGRLNEAEEKGLQSLQICERLYPNPSMETAFSHGTLARIYWKMRNYKLAEQHAKADLSICSSLKGEINTESAAALTTLHLIMRYMSDYQAAEEFAVQSYNMYAAFYGDFHPETTFSCINLCVMYRYRGKFKEAEEYGLRSASVWQQLEQYDMWQAGYTYLNLSTMYREMKEEEKAYAFAKLGVTVWEGIPQFFPNLLEWAKSVQKNSSHPYGFGFRNF